MLYVFSSLFSTDSSSPLVFSSLLSASQLLSLLSCVSLLATSALLFHSSPYSLSFKYKLYQFLWHLHSSYISHSAHKSFLNFSSLKSPLLFPPLFSLSCNSSNLISYTYVILLHIMSIHPSQGPFQYTHVSILSPQLQLDSEDLDHHHQALKQRPPPHT